MDGDDAFQTVLGVLEPGTPSVLLDDDEIRKLSAIELNNFRSRVRCEELRARNGHALFIPPIGGNPLELGAAGRIGAPGAWINKYPDGRRVQLFVGADPKT